MYCMWKEGRGGTLGDDMGPGSIPLKCTFLIFRNRPSNRISCCCIWKRGNSSDKKRMRLARERNLPYPRVLIICAESTMSNWEREFTTVPYQFPRLRVELLIAL